MINIAKSLWNLWVAQIASLPQGAAALLPTGI